MKLALALSAVVASIIAVYAALTVWPAQEPKVSVALTVAALALDIYRGLADRSRH